MKKSNNATFENIVRIAYMGIALVAFVANMLGAREKSIFIAIVLALMWVLTRILMEGIDAVRDFLKLSSTYNDADGLCKLLEKRLGRPFGSKAKAWYSVSWLDSLPHSVYIVFVSGEFDRESIPLLHGGKCVVTVDLTPNPDAESVIAVDVTP